MKSVERALVALEVLAQHRDPIGLVELSIQLQEPGPTTHRLLAVLVRAGFVVHIPATKKYGLGPAVLRLAHAFQEHNDLVRIAQPALDELTDRTRESSFLTQLLDGAAIVTAKADSPRSLRFYMQLGQRMPYHAAASARGILAYRSDEEAEVLLLREGLDPYTSATPTTLSAALSELRRVREQGFAICNEELEVGVTALSVPVRDARGEVAASVTIVAPHHRLLEEEQFRVVGLLTAAARRISVTAGLDPVLASAQYKATTVFAGPITGSER